MASTKWQLAVCGINHKTSELADREPLQIGRDEFAVANSLLARNPAVRESAIVSTCNRVEFYIVSDRSKDAIDIVADFYRELRNESIESQLPKFYTRKGKHAADHLFRVAAGIDSMVLGENQIVGQLKEAYTSACSVKAAGKLVHRLFHQAFRVGKTVRHDTDVGKGACSVSGASVSLLKSRIAELQRPPVLFVGVNQMVFLAASNLVKLDCGEFMFANRTKQKATDLAARFDSVGYSLDELPALLEKADIVVTCTGASDPVIGKQVIIDAVAARDGRMLTIMDMAIPRDVEFDSDSSDAVDLFDLEDVHKFMKDRQEKMIRAIPQAEDIIERKLSEFTYWYNHVLHEPLYNGLEDTFQAIRMEELGPIMNKLSPEMRASFDKASRRLVNRLLQEKLKAGTECPKSDCNRMEK